MFSRLLLLWATLVCAPALSHAEDAKKLFEVPLTIPQGTASFDVGALSLSPDNYLLAIGESDQALHLLEFPSGKEIKVLPPMVGVPRTARFSPDGKLVAVHAFVRDDKNAITGSVVALFETESGTKLWETTAMKYASQMAFWMGANEFALGGTPADKPGGGGATIVFDLKSGEIKRRLDFVPLSLGIDGQTVLGIGFPSAPKNVGDSTDPLTSILKWDMNAPRVDNKRVGVESRGGFAYNSAQSGALSADGSRMVAAGLYNAKLFDARSGDFLATFPDVGQNVAFDFSRDGHRLLIPNAFGAKIIDGTTGDSLASIAFPQPPKAALGQRDLHGLGVSDLSEDGKILVVAIPSFSSRTVYAYDLTSDAATLQPVGKNLFQFAAGNTVGSTLALSPDGKTLLAAGSSLLFWNSDTGARLRSPAGADVVGSVSWSKDGTHLLTGGTSLNTAQWWNATTFTVERTLGQHEWPINVVALSPDGTIAASGGSGFTGATRAASHGLVSLFDTRKGQRLKTLVAMTGRVTAITFSPDGKWLATGCDDGTLDIWEVAATVSSADPDGGKPVAHVDARSDNEGSIFDLEWSATKGLFVVRRGGNYGSISFGGGAGEIVKVVSWQQGVAKTIKTFRFTSDKTQATTAFALSGDARHFAVGESTGYDATSTIFVRDTTTGATVASLPVAGEVRTLIFSPDGRTLYLQWRTNKGNGAVLKWTFG